MPDLAENEPPPTDASPDGVDLTLIRAFLALTPAQRLQVVDDRNADLQRIANYSDRTGSGY